MRVLYVNNDGGGFAGTLEVKDNTTVQQFFEQQLPHGKPNNYLIKINRMPVTPDQCLVNGDRISITPVKIEGA